MLPRDKVEWSRERFLELVNATREAFNKTDGILSQCVNSGS